MVGVLEVDFVEPSHDKQVTPTPTPHTLHLTLTPTPTPTPNSHPTPTPKQDFERTDPMNKLEAKLKLLTPTYWMDEGQRVGYQSANPLPPTQAELCP